MKKILITTAMLISGLAFAAPSENASETGKQMANNKDNSAPALVGQDSSTWTPEYLQVKDFKMCLGVQNMRGWDGYCMPDEQPIECPDESWEQLQKMNLKPCQK